MTLDLDTFLTALYTIVDDLYSEHYAHCKPRRPGRCPELSDSEVLTLAVCAQWFGTSERAFIRHASEHWRDYFPRLLSQSSYNRRIRDMTGVLADLVGVVASEMRAYAAPYQAIDTVPVPLMRRCRGKRRRLFGDEAAIGRGGSDRDWYYGCKLMVSVTPEGISTGFLLGPASTEDRWVAESFFTWRINQMNTPFGLRELPSINRRNGKQYVGPTGPIRPRAGVGSTGKVPYIADNGFFGAWWQAHWRDDYGANVLTPKNYQGDGAQAARRQHSRRRQVVETINGHLEQVFGLHFPGARSAWGLVARVASKLVALNLGIWLNRLFDRPDLALATLFNR